MTPLESPESGLSNGNTMNINSPVLTEQWPHLVFLILVVFLAHSLLLSPLAHSILGISVWFFLHTHIRPHSISLRPLYTLTTRLFGCCGQCFVPRHSRFHRRWITWAVYLLVQTENVKQNTQFCTDCLHFYVSTKLAARAFQWCSSQTKIPSQ